MKISNFIYTMREKFNCGKDSLILDWLEFASEVADGSERPLEDELDETARALSYVKNNFDSNTFQSSLAYPTLANEIINGAILFRCLQPVEVVKIYADNGSIACGYIPKTFDEKNSLSLVYCSGRDRSVYMFHDISGDELLKLVQQAYDKAKEMNSTTGTVIEDMSRTDKRISCFGQGIIGAHMMNLFNGDKECSVFGHSIYCIPDLNEITLDKHPSLIAAEKLQALADNDESPCDDESQGFSISM